MAMRSPVLALVLTFAAVACAEKEPPIVPEQVAPLHRKPDRPEREHYLGMAVLEHEPVPSPNVIRFCEPGQRRSCMPGGSSTGGGPYMHCMDRGDGVLAFNRAQCNTPLVLSFDDSPVTFTSPAGSFPLGISERTEWVSARTPWLGLDTDGSGCIEGEAELFRFPKLRTLDENGDGRIDEHDPAYAALVLWFDRDQDRRCTPAETVSLAAAGVVALDLHDAAPARVPFGSHEGEHSTLWFHDDDGVLQRGRIVDVYLSPLP